MSAPYLDGLHCAWCRSNATAVCDFQTRGLVDGQIQPVRCKLPLCGLHRKVQAKGEDFCPSHHDIVHPEPKKAKAGSKRARAEDRDSQGPYGAED